jgi:hypothetical protein
MAWDISVAAAKAPFRVVEQILADALEVMLNLDTQVAQLVGRTDTRV